MPSIDCYSWEIYDVVPVNASRMIYEKVKNKSSKYCELIEFDGFHQIDSNDWNY